MIGLTRHADSTCDWVVDVNEEATFVEVLVVDEVPSVVEGAAGCPLGLEGGDCIILRQVMLLLDTLRDRSLTVELLYHEARIDGMN